MLGHQVGVLAQAIAGTFDLDDDGVMEQPVESGKFEEPVLGEPW